MYKKLFLLLLLHSLMLKVIAQENENYKSSPSQFGFTGMIYTPTAYIPEWKTIDIGFTHFTKETSFTYLGGIKEERAFNVNLVFLPRVELSVKLTRPYSKLRPDFQPGTGGQRNWGIGDRSYSLRIQVFQETEKLPAIVLGIQDPFANLAFFNTNYIVASKSFKFNELRLIATGGYGKSWEDTRGDYLQGLFGGLQVNWKNINGMVEYDTEFINIGMGYQFRNLLFLNVALIDAKHFSGNISFRYSLN